MGIHPTIPGGTPGPDQGRGIRVKRGWPVRPGGHAPAPPRTDSGGRDTLRISTAARRLDESAAGRGSAKSSIEPERSRAILDRIAEGFYDRPEIRERLAESLFKALADPASAPEPPEAPLD